MPYIREEERQALDVAIDELYSHLTSPGRLNYAITRLILNYMPRQAEASYQMVAEVTGVLENVKQEFYRRYAAPYEDRKIAENGDVY